VVRETRNNKTGHETVLFTNRFKKLRIRKARSLATSTRFTYEPIIYYRKSCQGNILDFVCLCLCHSLFYAAFCILPSVICLCRWVSYGLSLSPLWGKLPADGVEFFFCSNSSREMKQAISRDKLDCAVIEKDTSAFLATAWRCRRHPADYAKTSGIVVVEGKKFLSAVLHRNMYGVPRFSILTLFTLLFNFKFEKMVHAS